MMPDEPTVVNHVSLLVYKSTYNILFGNDDYAAIITMRLVF